MSWEQLFLSLPPHWGCCVTSGLRPLPLCLPHCQQKLTLSSLNCLGYNCLPSLVITLSPLPRLLLTSASKQLSVVPSTLLLASSQSWILLPTSSSHFFTPPGRSSVHSMLLQCLCHIASTHLKAVKQMNENQGHKTAQFTMRPDPFCMFSGSFSKKLQNRLPVLELDKCLHSFKGLCLDPDVLS